MAADCCQTVLPQDQQPEGRHQQLRGVPRPPPQPPGIPVPVCHVPHAHRVVRQGNPQAQVIPGRQESQPGQQRQQPQADHKREHPTAQHQSGLPAALHGLQ